jgi:hypothetical protein
MSDIMTNLATVVVVLGVIGAWGTVMGSVLMALTR